MQDVLWRVDDVARWLGISESKVYKLVSRKRIPFLRIDSSLRFHREQLEEWVKAGGTESTRQPTISQSVTPKRSGPVSRLAAAHGASRPSSR